jgi:hypothetical protein
MWLRSYLSKQARDPARFKLNGIAKRMGVRKADLDPRQLRIGTRVEMEHTRDRRTAEHIAMDHLAEDPRYYTKLLRYVEKGHRAARRDPQRRRFKRPGPAAQARISRKIRTLRHEGYPPRQAAAIAYRMYARPLRKR